MEPHIRPLKNLEDRLSNRVKKNQTAVDFTLKASSAVNKIARPLLDFDIRIFTYCRIFEDGKRWYLCNDQSWVEHYLSNHYQDRLEHLQHYIPEEGVQCTLWSEFKTDKIFDTLKNDFSYGHGISMYERQPHYVDYFDFGSHRDNHDITNFYFNNLGV